MNWLTVVTVVRDDTAGLLGTVASVREQAGRDGVEHLIIDGASADGTAEAALALAGEPGMRVISEPDRGIYDAMNKALALASGRHLQYLNAGDRYRSPHEIAWLRRSLGVGDAPWLRTRVQFVDSTRRPSRPLAPAVIDERFARGRQAVFHQGAVMRADVLAALGGFDTRYSIVADHDLMRRALAAGVVPLVSDRVTVTVDDGGVSTAAWPRALAELHRSRSADAPLPRRVRSAVDWGLHAGQVGGRRALRRTAEQLVGGDRLRRWRLGG